MTSFFLGQIVNNHKTGVKPNVVYQELDINIIHSEEEEEHISYYHILPLLPNINYDFQFNQHRIKLVPIVALREINENQELFSSYFTLID